MADPMQEDVDASHLLEAQSPQPMDVAGLGGHDEIMLMLSDRHDDDTHENLERKRASEAPADEDDEDDSSPKRRKTNPPPKKLNNEQWDLMFDRLVEYKRQHGDCLVPKRYAADPKLGTWVETQRIQWKKLPRTQAEAGEVVTPNRRLNDERLRRLESIGFAWSAKNNRKPKAASPLAEPTNGASRAKKANMPRDPAARAAARQQENDNQWNEMYNRLAAYKAKHGDCLVPKKYTDDLKLGTWVESQRNLYNREHKTKLKVDSGASSNEESSPTEAAMPPQAALIPEAKSPEEWAEEMEIAATGAAMGVDDVEAAAMEVVHEVTAPAFDADEKPAAFVEDSVIGGEVYDDKDAFKRLTQERKDKLEALGFVWSLRSKRTDDHWDEMYRQLVEYKKKHGDCLVPSRYEDNSKLGKWVETQRYEYTKLQRVAGQKAEPRVESPTEVPEDEKEGKKFSTHPRLTEERLRRLEAVGFEWKVKNKMKRYYDRQWDAMFDKLLQFKEKHGHCLIPKRYPEEKKLGTWVHTQRIQYRKLLAGTSSKEAQMDEADDGEQAGEDANFRLTEDRRRRLDEVGFIWSARENEKATEPAKVARNSYDDQWDAMFERLRAYKEQHGDCLVPKRFADDLQLGTWVDTQRVQKKKMEKHLASQNEPTGASSKARVRLTTDRISRLERLGFVWSLRDDWQKHYQELKVFKEENGHCNVPARHANNRRLGIWVSAQRQQKKILDNVQAGEPKPSKPTPLTQQRIDLLDELGFTWTIRSRDSLGESWNQRLAELKVYKEEHGNCLVPSRYPPNPELGVWVGTQRTQYRLYVKAKEAGKASSTSAMNDDRIAQLEELGFVWALRGGSDSAWKKRISELVEYRAIHGDSAVPGDYRANEKLASWATAQREQYRLMQEGKPSSLDEEKVAELDTLQFSWDDPKTAAAVEEGVDSAGFVGVMAAAAAADCDIANGVPIDLEDQILGGIHDADNDDTAENILNVEI